MSQADSTAGPILPNRVIVRKDSAVERKAPGEGIVKGQTVLVVVWLLILGLCASLGMAQEVAATTSAPPQPTANTTKTASGEPILTGESIIIPAEATEQQLTELLRLISQQIQSTKGYTPLASVEASSPAAKASVNFDLVNNYELSTLTGSKRVLQIGVQLLTTQPDHIFVQGYELADGSYTANPDIEGALGIVRAVLEGIAVKQKELWPRDLTTMVYQLNYVGAVRALDILRVMGYTIIDPKTFDPSKPIDPKNLPAVCKMPDPEKASLAATDRQTRAFGIMLPGEAAQEFDTSTTGGPLERLLIIYDPNLSRDSLARLLELLSNQIDVAARQLLIEGMVLEVSETGIEQLGVQYDLGRYDAAGTNARGAGTFQTAAGETVRPLILTFDSSIRGALDRYRVVLRALIRSGEAQVLSRPSILALDNRQARIRVTTEVPVSSTNITQVTTELKVEYISVGIVLNIRPRISSSGEDVSFQIEASVSDIDPTSPFRIELDPAALLSAQAPVVLTRQVQTYARIRNNTPLIIGGLISKRSSTETDRIPFLSDIPILGWLFKSRGESTERREVIIVLTPYVLPERIAVNRAMPMDSDKFDEIDPILFRATYRIRIQDVFDLSFLRNNAELAELTAQAKALVQARPELANQPLFRVIVAGQIPGETILVERMTYQIIKKLKLMEKVAPNNLILFKKSPAEPAGFEVQFLSRELSGERGGDLEEYFKQYPGRALAITFKVPKEVRAQEVMRQSVPEIRVLELKDRSEWGKKLYELNQPVDGVPRWTILINSPKDMERLKAALVLKRTVDLHQGDEGFQLRHFQVGRQLTFPVVDPKRTYLIDWEVAKYFYHTEHYYAAFQKALAEGLTRLRAEISRQKNMLEPVIP